MSESLGLGEADADTRLIGVRRHQAVVVVVGVGVTGDWIMSGRTSLAELVMGLMILASALPAGDGLTSGETIIVAARFSARSHWCDLVMRELGDDVVLWARGEASFRGYELVHRGRLDLSGRDVTLAEDLAAVADAASAARSGQHFSQHVVWRDGGATTMLALSGEVPAPDGWRAHGEARARRCWRRADDVAPSARALYVSPHNTRTRARLSRSRFLLGAAQPRAARTDAAFVRTI